MNLGEYFHRENAMKDAGFEVTTEKVEICAGNYLEIKGTKR